MVTHAGIYGRINDLPCGTTNNINLL